MLGPTSRTSSREGGGGENTARARKDEGEMKNDMVNVDSVFLSLENTQKVYVSLY